MTTVNPYIGLISFQDELNKKTIAPQLIEPNKNYYLFLDKPSSDSLRLTYALIIPNKVSPRLKKQVRAICQITPVEPYFDGKAVLQVGCAVLDTYQNQGLAKTFVGDCLNIFAREFISRNNIQEGIYFEAIIDRTNIPSQKLFEYLGFQKEAETDEGDFQYFKFVNNFQQE